MNYINKSILINYSKDFVDLSGDNNPLHVDKTYSRRLLYGKPVIHGVFTLLKILDFWVGNNKKRLNFNTLKVKFIKPVFNEDSLDLNISEANDNVKIQVYIKSVLSLSISFSFSLENNFNLNKGYINETPEIIIPKEISSDNLLGLTLDLNLYLHKKLFEKLFPYLFKNVSLNLMSVILASTRAVGVYCPGSNSLYSELNIKKSDSFNPKFDLNIPKIYKSLNLAKMEFKASFYSGSIKAFVRKDAQKQIKFKDVLKLIQFDLFKNEKVLVIGGSRGLGEVTAKILAAGGAKVTITYNRGKIEAENISNELNEYNACCDILKLDINNHDVLKGLKSKTFTSMFYFATPFIETSDEYELNEELLKKFNEFYVVNFYKIVQKLKIIGVKNIFYPSTIFIDELPYNLKEYSIAKMSGEIICSYINKLKDSPKIYFPRMEKMRTDQTAGLLDSETISSFPVLSKEILKFYNL